MYRGSFWNLVNGRHRSLRNRAHWRRASSGSVSTRDAATSRACVCIEMSVFELVGSERESEMQRIEIRSRDCSCKLLGLGVGGCADVGR